MQIMNYANFANDTFCIYQRFHEVVWSFIALSAGNGSCKKSFKDQVVPLLFLTYLCSFNFDGIWLCCMTNGIFDWLMLSALKFWRVFIFLFVDDTCIERYLNLILILKFYFFIQDSYKKNCEY